MHLVLPDVGYSAPAREKVIQFGDSEGVRVDDCRIGILHDMKHSFGSEHEEMAI